MDSSVFSPDLQQMLLSRVGEGLLLFEGEELRFCNALGRRTFRARGDRDGTRFTPWLDHQRQRFRHSHHRRWHRLFQQPVGNAVKKFSVSFERPGDRPELQLIRSRALGRISLWQPPDRLPYELWQWQRQGDRAIASPGLYPLLGLGPQPILGRREMELLLGERLEQMLERSQPGLLPRQRLLCLSRSQWQADGSRSWLRFVVQFCLDPRGRLGGVQIWVEDRSSSHIRDFQTQVSQDLFHSMLSTNLVAKLLLGAEGDVLLANDAAADLFGRASTEDLEGQFLGLPLSPGEVVALDIPRPDGEIRAAELTIQPLPMNPGRAYLATLADLTPRRRAEEQLQIYRQAWEQSPVSIVITDADARIEYVNPCFEQVSGYRLAEVRGLNPRILASGGTAHKTYAELWETLRRGEVWRGEFQNRRRNGELYWEAASISPIRDSVGQVTHYVAVKEDISERKRHEAQLQYQAHHDGLTGLPNRVLVLDRLEQAIARAQRQPHPLGVLFIDLDRFKQVNDQAGHAAGDRLLEEVGRRLQSVTRQSDTVARLSGDEFVILCFEYRDPSRLEQLARRIIEAISQPFAINGEEFFITSSIGISLHPEDGSTAEELLTSADRAMYAAKQQGGHAFRFFTPRMNARIAWRNQVESLLRRSLERRELAVHFQPVVRLSNHEVVGAEALLRWFSPQLGAVPTEQFVAIAEDTGLIDRLGDWVLGEASRHMQTWAHEQSRPLWVSVNLSPRQIRNPQFGQTVFETLEQVGLPCSQLRLEITERLLLEDLPQTESVLESLHRARIGLAIDDFGTGYSALNYLRRFPFRVLKIDRSFIQEIPERPEACVLTRTILAMAHELGLEVIAEGIETEAQAAFLRQHGCDYGQGFLFSPARSPVEFGTYLRDRVTAISG